MQLLVQCWGDVDDLYRTCGCWFSVGGDLDDLYRTCGCWFSVGGDLDDLVVGHAAPEQEVGHHSQLSRRVIAVTLKATPEATLPDAW